MKKYVLAAALIGAIGFTSFSMAAARGNYGYGPGPGNGDCGGYGYCNNAANSDADNEKGAAFFDETKETIRNFQGCLLLELFRDRKDPRVFFTYSYWNSEDDLEAYRSSDFFRNVWGKTKLLFEIKPVAWSVDKVASLN